MKKKKRRIWPFLLILLLLLAIAAGVVIFLGGRGGGAELDTSVQPSPLLLQASQTEFRLAKGAQTELTVTAREATQGTITIRDDRGEELLTMELQEADGKGVATGLLPVFETEPRLIHLTASMGEAQSQPLSLYVTPEVTIDMIAVCAQTAEDLGQALIDQGFTTIDEKAVEAATEWLEQDPRVDEVVPMDNGVFFYTTDGIPGCCMLPPIEGTFGASSGFTQKGDNDALIAFKRTDPSEYKYVWSSDTLTNDQILVLRPQYHAEITDKKQIKDLKKEDPTIHNDSPSDTATWLAERLNWPEPAIFNDREAIHMLTSSTMNEYGVIMMNTHGSMIGKEGIPQNEKLFAFLLQTGNTFRSLDEPYEAYVDHLQKYLAVSPEDYSRFYTKYTYNAEQNLKTSQLFIQVALDVFDALEQDTENQKNGVETPVRTKIGLLGTSNMLKTLYGNTMFDNSIIYFSICYSADNPELAQFFVDHGAALYVGYTGPVGAAVDASTCSDFFGHMTIASENEPRLYNIRESCAERGSVGIWRGLTTAGGHFSNVLHFFMPNTFAHVGEDMLDQFNMAALTNRPEYTFSGTGTLNGRVAMKESKQPSANTVVTLYYWRDQKFELVGDVVTGQDGTFSFKDIPWGVYVAKAVTDTGAETAASCILAEKELDAKYILVPETSPYYPFIRDVLEPEYGLFELGERQGNATAMMHMDWDDRSGILSAAIADLNGDGTDEMILLRVDRFDRGGVVRQRLYANLYVTEDGKVVHKDTVDLTQFNNAEIHDFWAALVPKADGKGMDFYFESYARGCVVDYRDPIYGRYAYDKELGLLLPEFRIEQTGGGSDGSAEYTNLQYDKEQDHEYLEPLPWLFDINKECQNWLPAHMKPFEPQREMQDGYPSYIGTHEFTSIAVVGCSGPRTGGTFTMTYLDDSGLREALEELDIKSVSETED